MQGKEFKKDLDHLRSLVSLIRNKYDLSLSQLTSLMDSAPETNTIPLHIFSNDDLGTMEIIVTYLKDNQNISIPDISKLLDRAEGSLWASYYKAKNKLSSQINFTELEQRHNKTLLKFNLQKINIPISILKERNLSPLQSIVLYLKNNFQLKNIQISKLLVKDSQTIWSAINNAQKKLDSKLNKKLESRNKLYENLQKRGE